MIPSPYLKKHWFLAPSKPIFSTKRKPSWQRHFDGLVFVAWLCGNRYSHCIRSAESQYRTSTATATWTNHHESSWWQFVTGTVNKKMEWLINVLLESPTLHMNVVSSPKKHSGKGPSKNIVNNKIIRKTKGTLNMQLKENTKKKLQKTPNIKMREWEKPKFLVLISFATWFAQSRFSHTGLW